ncbi:hypothetical protein GCM10023142_31770 [Anaerocolumna aminovalerica]|uniref:Uncharacterized protein n=1 Tax=Anaerocolumna aminovalerica TaxID=1527 RepID=A0A1I5JDF6_9FIRM|nr:hypothetical protein [Anaerocolumna aminovalerica]SFO70406.1 hypothetical protein SAMN04489757_1832 [Anaerocolumna aminovalerica]
MSKIKKSKIKTRTIIITGVILFLFIKIVSHFFITPREIQELNINTNFPYKLISPLEEFDKEGWEEHPDYNEIYYENPQVGCIVFMGYPDLINSRKVTYIYINNPKFFLFGIRVGDSMTIVDSIMKENGYRRKKADDDYESSQKVYARWK